MVVGLGTPSLAMDNDATMQEFDDINAYNEVTVFTETMGRALRKGSRKLKPELWHWTWKIKDYLIFRKPA